MRVVYILALILLTLGALAMLFSGFSMLGNVRTAGSGVLILLATPLGFLLDLAMIRMTMETYVAITRAANELSRIRDSLGHR